jgi:hypothetical protein
MACSLPHNTSLVREFGPASASEIASSLCFVGIMPMRVQGTFASINTAPTIQCQSWLVHAASKPTILKRQPGLLALCSPRCS